MSAKEILQRYWGYDTFRPLQEDIINSVMDGTDTLALLPTGGGKSVCFQVPALAKEGICLVISPLIALIKDQVEQLKNRGIPVLAIYAGMSFIEIKKTLQNAAYGNYKFLYISPERIETKLFAEYLPALSINLIAIDEAHCISQWGYDFRPTYLRIATIREQLPQIPMIALTASATQIVQNDICEKLLFSSSHKRFQQSFERPNLSYSVFNIADKQNKLLTILRNVKGSAIVYCKSRRHTKEVTELLTMHNVNADYYHAGLTHEQRNTKQEAWIRNKIRVMVCTNAFGMGIDKPDVRIVVHYGIPDCLENYYQEAGRAGRDGKKSYAILLYNNKEMDDLLLQIDIRYPSVAEIKYTYQSIMNYLQIPAGYGEGLSYDFDIVTFCSVFKIKLLSASYTVKLLEQEDILTYNELFFKPSSVVFTSSKEDLLDFEKQYPQLDDLVKGLLRSYEGIYDFPVHIYENQLAKFIKKPIEIIKQQLLELHQLKIIEYNPQKENPQITLLKNKMYNDSYSVNMVNYFKRKEAYTERIKSMHAYILEQKICRSKLIAQYFNAGELKSCGICDNCINRAESTITRSEFENLRVEVLALISQQTKPVQVILGSYNTSKKNKLIKVIEFLISEKVIGINKSGDLIKL